MPFRGKALTHAGLLLTMFMLTGCGGTRGVLVEPSIGGATGAGGPQPGDRTGPTLSNAGATLPAGFRWTAGSVTLQVDATDVSGIESVTAAVVRQKTNEVTQVTLTSTAAPTYSGPFAAPPNLNNDGSAEEYEVTFTATDNAGNQSTAATSFEVPAAATAQTPPTL